MRVPLADLAQQYRSMEGEILAAVKAVLESGQFTLGPFVAGFEERVAEVSGARFAVGLNSGTDALLLALLAQGISPGDEVITSPFTFVATVEAIVQAGGRPVFADIDPATFLLDLSAVEKAITPKTRAIMPVDLFGQMVDRDAYVLLADRHGLSLTWDAAQAIGAGWNGKRLGEFPGAATLSFFPTKNLGAAGDGGMVLTNDEGIRDRLRQYRFHGSGGGYIYSLVGYCSRLDALQAAVLGAKLPYLDHWNESRRRNAASYMELLGNGPVALPVTAPRARHVYHQFTIRSSRRDALQAHLKANEIDSGIYYPLALHLQEAYRGLGYQPGDFPNAEAATREVLSLPVHPGLSDEQVGYVAGTINGFSG